MADPVTQLILNLNQVGFYNLILPWIFTFAVVFGLLVKINLFGDQVNKRVSAALAFVIAFFVTGFAGPQLASFFITIFGGASIVIAGILVILLFLAMAGWIPTMQGPKGTGWKAALAILIAIGVLLFLLSSGVIVTGVALTSDIVLFIFVIVIIVLAIYFITAEKEAAAPSAGGQQGGRTQ